MSVYIQFVRESRGTLQCAPTVMTECPGFSPGWSPFTIYLSEHISCYDFYYYVIMPIRKSWYIVARIAQLVEQLTLNQWVQGSSPCAGTKFIVYYTNRFAGNMILVRV